MKRRPEIRHERQRRTCDLDDDHQRNRDEIQEQTGEGHPSKQGRAHRHQDKLRAHRGHEDRQCGAAGGVDDGTAAFPPELRSVPIRQRCTNEDAQRRAERENETRIEDRSRITRDAEQRRNRQGVQWRTAMIDQSSGEEDHRRRDGPLNGWRRTGDQCVEQQRARSSTAAPTAAGRKSAARHHHQKQRDDGDIAARNGDDVIRAGVLQTLLVIFGQAGSGRR